MFFFVFFSLAEYVPNLVDFCFPCLTMIQFFFVIYSFYSLHVWELIAFFIYSIYLWGWGWRRSAQLWRQLSSGAVAAQFGGVSGRAVAAHSATAAAAWRWRGGNGSLSGGRELLAESSGGGGVVVHCLMGISGRLGGICPLAEELRNTKKRRKKEK